MKGLGAALIKRRHEAEEIEERRKAEQLAASLPSPLPFSTPEELNKIISYIEKQLRRNASKGLFFLKARKVISKRYLPLKTTCLDAFIFLHAYIRDAIFDEFCKRHPEWTPGRHTTYILEEKNVCYIDRGHNYLSVDILAWYWN